MVMQSLKEHVSMNKTLNKIKAIVENVKQRIDDWQEECNADMEKWKAEDPEAYYEYIATQYYKQP